MGLLRHLLGPGIVGPHHLEDGAGCQPAHGEPPRAVEERSPVDVSLHDRSSLIAGQCN